MVNPASHPSEAGETRGQSTWGSGISAQNHQAERIFLALARSPGMEAFLGRLRGATDEELRSVFSLCLAAIRQTGQRGVAPGPEESLGSRLPDDRVVSELKSRLERMSAALAKREREIRRLTAALSRRC